MRVLIVEDDEDAAAFIVAGLTSRGHAVEPVADGRRGLTLALAGGYDVIVLDRMLPGLDGLSIVASMRSAGVAAPVLFLTNLSAIGDRVEGFAAGGDDYLVKPFAIEELVARLEALARRPILGDASTRLAAGDIELDLIGRVARRGGQALDLQPREFQLLEYFLRSEGRVVTRKMLLEQVWRYDFDPHTNIVETHISRLRAKLDRGRVSSAIVTIRGLGYALRAE